MTDDTISLEEVFRETLHQPKTIKAIVDRVADYFYIYGPERATFTASWCGHLRDAAVRDCPNGDNNDLQMFAIDWYVNTGDPYDYSRRIVNEMLKDAAEYTAYDLLDKEAVVQRICEQMQVAYEEHKKRKFVDKLAGKFVRGFE